MSKRYGNAHEHFDLLREVTGPVLSLGFAKGIRYRSVLEITGACLLDAEKQQELYELYHTLFLSLDYPIQIIVRIQSLDPESYLRYVEPPATEEEAASWETLAHEHAAFLRALTQRRPLLGRRFYLVLPAEEEGGATFDLEEAARHLRLRSETLIYHLQALGLSCRLLVKERLSAFYYSFFLPQDRQDGQPIPPDQLKIERDCLTVSDRYYLRVLSLAHLPRQVGFGWLKPLIELDETLDFIHTLRPHKTDRVVNYLRRQQAHAQAELLQSAGAGRLASASATIANDDLGPLIEHLSAGEQRMLDSSLSVVVRATSKAELDQKSRHVSQRINTTCLHRPRACTFEQGPVFRACLPGVIMGGYDPLLLPSPVIASMIPYHDHFVFRPSERAILEGITPHDEPFVVDWWRDLTNANRLMFGPSGWGKSYKSKIDVKNLYYVYKNYALRHRLPTDAFQIIVVDPERETHRAAGFSLVEALGGQSIRLSPGSAHRLNVLDLPPVTASLTELDAKEDILANHIHRLHAIFDCLLAHNVEDKQTTLLPQEKSLLDAALYTCYEQAGIFPDRRTHQRPAPLLRDLFRILAEEVCGPDPTGLAHRLMRYVNGSLSSLFSAPTNINLDNSLVQFDVKDLGELRPVSLLMISNFIWNTALAFPFPRFVFLDELATMTRYASGQRFLEELFRRARKYFISVTGITQETDLLSPSIIANSASHFLFHQDDSTLATAAEFFQLSARERQQVRGLAKGEALALVGGKRLVIRFVASAAEDRLFTTNRRQLAALEGALYTTQPMTTLHDEQA